MSFRLEPHGDGTRLFFEHTGFDVSQPWAEQAIQGAKIGWAEMLEKLPAVAVRLTAERVAAARLAAERLATDRR